MTKLFKNSKQIFAFVIAFAIIAVSLFTGVAINADAACATDNVIYWAGDAQGETANTLNDAVGGVTQAGTASDPIIIDNAGELYVLATGLGSGNATNENKYYKIADGIDAIVLQPQGTAAADVLNLADAEAVKTHFTSNPSGRKAWKGSSSNLFTGNLDGNGVTIYGLYSTSSPSGLFPYCEKNVSISNLTLKNCYTYSYQGAVLVGRNNSPHDTYTTSFDTVALINCYGHSWNSSNIPAISNTALLAVLGTRAKVNNLLVYGSVAAFEGTDSIAGVKGTTSLIKVGGSDGVSAWFTNSIVLDVAPYTTIGTYTDASGVPHESTIGYSHHESSNFAFSNVITNMNTTEVKYSNKTFTYKEEEIKQISDTQGAAIRAVAPDLDWENTWFETKGVPELRKFHNLTAVTPDANGHGYKCADCDIDAVVDHTWGEDYKCTVCGYACKHDNGNLETTNTSGDCVTAPGQYVSCKECGYYNEFTTGTAPGHKFELGKGKDADCLNTGIYDYWHCTVCGGNYLGDKEELLMAPIADGKKDPAVDFVSPIGGHSQKTDADGVVIIIDGANGHYYECSVCDGKLDHKSEELAEGQVVAHEFSASVCKDCGWKCEEHDYELTGNVLVIGDCYTDREDELKCTICGKQQSKVTKASHNIVAVEEVKATDNLEGTKAHYQCTECKSIYADAEGKTSVTKASLVIPKKLPTGYENTYEGTGGATAPENADTSNKSPSTADSVMTAVAAIVVLMGAAIVVVRKAVKA